MLLTSSHLIVAECVASGELGNYPAVEAAGLLLSVLQTYTYRSLYRFEIKILLSSINVIIYQIIGLSSCVYQTAHSYHDSGSSYLFCSFQW